MSHDPLPSVLLRLPRSISNHLASTKRRILSRNESDYLFCDKRGPWAGDQLSVALASATTTHLGVRLTVQSWRQVAIAMANEHLGRAIDVWDIEGDDDDEELGQAKALFAQMRVAPELDVDLPRSAKSTPSPMQESRRQRSNWPLLQFKNDRPLYKVAF
jgi:hypothetical protein